MPPPQNSTRTTLLGYEELDIEPPPLDPCEDREGAVLTVVFGVHMSGPLVVPQY